MTLSPKAESVTKEGEADGFEIPAAFFPQHDTSGPTRLLVSVPTRFLPSVHQDLLRALSSPLSILYRQKVDRRDPRPEGAPPRDFLAVDIDPVVLITAIDECRALIYHDARFELWIRGLRGEQIILDGDGLIYCYPDDPSFRDICLGNGLVFGEVQTLLKRDYVKHWFSSENDALEAAFIEGLGLVEMASQR